MLSFVITFMLIATTAGIAVYYYTIVDDLLENKFKSKKDLYLYLIPVYPLYKRWKALP